MKRRRILVILLIVSAAIGVGTSAAALTGVLTITPGAESLQLVDNTIANVTLRNVGSNTVTLVKVDVQIIPDFGYNFPLDTIYFNPQIVMAGGQATTIPEMYTGSGWNVTVHFFSERGSIFTWTLLYHSRQPYPSTSGVKIMINRAHPSGIGFYADIYYGGPAGVTIPYYSITDTNGNRWENSGWDGLCQLHYCDGTAYRVIGPSSGAVYTGAAGAFDTFKPGNYYTIVYRTSTNDKFFFWVTA